MVIPEALAEFVCECYGKVKAEDDRQAVHQDNDGWLTSGGGTAGRAK